MRKVMFIGRTGSGKTTLCQSLHQLDIKYKKTQAIDVYNYAIDTPGEYIENRGYYTALLTTACDADVVAMVIDPTIDDHYIPMGFFSLFSQPVIGIITKINLVNSPVKINSIKNLLEDSGISKIFLVDTLDNIGIGQLVLYLDDEVN